MCAHFKMAAQGAPCTPETYAFRIINTYQKIMGQMRSLKVGSYPLDHTPYLKWLTQGHLVLLLSYMATSP